MNNNILVRTFPDHHNPFNLAITFGLLLHSNRCCNNCPRDRCPRRQLSKGLLSNDTVVQADYCPVGLLSKEAFVGEKLTQIVFSYFLLEDTTFINYRI